MSQAIVAMLLLASGAPDTVLHEACLYPTVKVSAGREFGTAVVVRSRPVEGGYLNTAFTVQHVVDVGPPTVTVYRYRDWSTVEREDRYPARVARSDVGKDAAVLTFRTPGRLRAATIDWRPRLYIGHELCRFGCGVGSVPRADFGRVTAPAEVVGTSSVPMIRMGLPTIGGDSGGGVFRGGRLVALTEASTSRPFHGVEIPVETVGYALPIRDAFTPEDLE